MVFNPCMFADTGRAPLLRQALQLGADGHRMKAWTAGEAVGGAMHRNTCPEVGPGRFRRRAGSRTGRLLTAGDKEAGHGI